MAAGVDQARSGTFAPAYITQYFSSAQRSSASFRAAASPDAPLPLLQHKLGLRAMRAGRRHLLSMTARASTTDRDRRDRPPAPNARTCSRGRRRPASPAPPHNGGAERHMIGMDAVLRMVGKHKRRIDVVDHRRTRVTSAARSINSTDLSQIPSRRSSCTPSSPAPRAIPAPQRPERLTCRQRRGAHVASHLAQRRAGVGDGVARCVCSAIVPPQASVSSSGCGKMTSTCRSAQQTVTTAGRCRALDRRRARGPRGTPAGVGRGVTPGTATSAPPSRTGTGSG